MNSKIFALLAMAVATSCSPASATTFFADDFSTFAPGNLVGQNGWVQAGASATLPLQVSGGNVVIPGAQIADNQDASKTLGGTIATTTYAGLSLNLSAASASNPSYFFALLESTGGFANARLAAIDNSAVVPNTYLLEARYTGQAGNPFVAGAPLTYGVTYNVVEKAIITPSTVGEGVVVYVNPTSNNEGAQIPYLTALATTGFLTPPAGFTAATISQFGSATVFNSAVKIDHVYMADTFGEAARVPEPDSFVIAGIAAVFGLVACRRRQS